MCISCLISVYAKANPEHFKEALASIYSQTLPPDEIVLIEDGALTPDLHSAINELDNNPIEIELNPDDSAADIEKKLADARENTREILDGEGCQKPSLIIGHFAENVMLGRALAAGVNLCSGPYIARMDADDVAYPQRFEVQLDYMQKHPHIDVLGSAIEEFDGKGMKRIKRIPSGEDLLSYAKYRCPVNHMTVMMKKGSVLAAGNYRHFPGLEDYDLWSRALAHGLVLDNLNEPLVHARVDSNFYDRRGGTGYGKLYMELRKQQRSDGLVSRTEYAKAKLATSVMVYSPSWLRKMIYKVLRRES